MSTLVVEKREKREKLNSDKIPAIIYGEGANPQNIALSEKELTLELAKKGYNNRIYTLDCSGEKITALPKEVQYHPVTDRPIHADFLRVGEKTRVRVRVPIRFINEQQSPAIKRGAFLNTVVHHLEIKSLPATLPQEFVIDLTGYTLQDTVSLDKLNLPEGVSAMYPERDHIIATIVPPAGAEEEGKTEE